MSLLISGVNFSSVFELLVPQNLSHVLAYKRTPENIPSGIIYRLDRLATCTVAIHDVYMRTLQNIWPICNQPSAAEKTMKRPDHRCGGEWRFTIIHHRNSAKLHFLNCIPTWMVLYNVPILGSLSTLYLIIILGHECFPHATRVLLIYQQLYNLTWGKHALS